MKAEARDILEQCRDWEAADLFDLLLGIEALHDRAEKLENSKFAKALAGSIIYSITK